MISGYQKSKNYAIADTNTDNDDTDNARLHIFLQ